MRGKKIAIIRKKRKENDKASGRKAKERED